MALIAPSTLAGGRDPRLDLFRGLALVMIFIDHIPGNPYEAWTIRNLGFSDAAEAFFFMSGVAAGMAYSGRFQRRAETGLWPAVKPMWLRAFTLYKTQVVLTLSVIAIYALTAMAFGDLAILKNHNIAATFADPLRRIPAIFAMSYQIGYVDILPAYVVLLLAAPALILLGLKRPWLLLTLSVALWFIAGLTRLNIPTWPGNGAWFFDPFSWQLIFCIGLATGILAKRGTRLVPVNGPLFTLALALLVFIYAWKHVPEIGQFMNRQMWLASEAGAPYLFVAHNKSLLALPRLLHVLALIYVLSCLPMVTRAAGHALAQPIRLMGQQGLEVFAWGTVLAMSAQALMDATGDPAILGIMLPPLGLLALWAIAWEARRSKTAPVSTPVPAE